LLADKKKTGVLTVLTVVALVMAYRTFGGGSSLPAKASAAVATAEAAEPAVKAAPAARNDARRDEYLAKLDREIRRDLFAVDFQVYPLREGTVPEAVSPAGMDEQMEELRRRQAETQRLAEQEEHERIIRTQALTLRLQSTMLGARPTAIINGQVLSLGDVINGFSIKSIGSGQCVVTCGGVDVTLIME
jgi:hypothetical protein